MVLTDPLVHLDQWSRWFYWLSGSSGEDGSSGITVEPLTEVSISPPPDDLIEYLH
jgi:hypothetical protein